MFNRISRSALAEVEKEEPEFADILRAINELLRMARGKLQYIQKVLQYYNRGAYFEPDKTKQYLTANLRVLTIVEKLLEKEQALESEEARMIMVFRKEIANLEDARRALKKLRHIIEKENNLMRYFGSNVKVIKGEVVSRPEISYKILVAMAEYVKQEMELLGIEAQKIQEVSDMITRIKERITNYRKLPLVKARYYYGSFFIFNVGDHARPSRRILMGGVEGEVENIVEEVRQKEFPERPSRDDAIYVTKDPWAAEQYGRVYAVEVQGLTFDTDQDIHTEAVKSWRDKRDKKDVKEWAREYWKGRSHSIPETVVKGSVIILGLADYFRRGDKIEVIVDGITDEKGRPVPKGSRGKIDNIARWIDDLPFDVDMDSGQRVILPASAVRRIKK